ncbi:MAG: ATP-binding protein [Pseudoflavonifractor sp.]
MKDLSLHVLDIAQNSVTAGAKHLDISLADRAGLRTLVITDDGRGMAPEFLAAVTDPFTTTRSTRKVGLGLPLLRMAAEQTGGSLQIESKLGMGTRVSVSFYYEHIDCPPVGDMAGTVALLVQGAPELELRYTRDGNTFDTREVRAVLGPDISLSAPEVVLWMQDYMKELSL